jgi:hypothetical protein
MDVGRVKTPGGNFDELAQSSAEIKSRAMNSKYDCEDGCLEPDFRIAGMFGALIVMALTGRRDKRCRARIDLQACMPPPR